MCQKKKPTNQNKQRKANKQTSFFLNKTKNEMEQKGIPRKMALSNGTSCLLDNTGKNTPFPRLLSDLYNS